MIDKDSNIDHIGDRRKKSVLDYANPALGGSSVALLLYLLSAITQHGEQISQHGRIIYDNQASVKELGNVIDTWRKEIKLEVKSFHIENENLRRQTERLEDQYSRMRVRLTACDEESSKNRAMIVEIKSIIADLMRRFSNEGSK